MSNYAGTFILLIYSLSVQAQVIKGTVLDEITHLPIPSAVIFFNGTGTGTYTDNTGKFQLDSPAEYSIPVTITALGYQTVTISNTDIRKSYLIYLRPKVYELNEVVISASLSPEEINARRENLRIFREAFLGRTMNAMRSRILNESEIALFRKDDTLKAYCQSPVIIENKAFGYRIDYYLEKFEYSESARYYCLQGNCFFFEDTAGNTARLNRFEKRRRSAYLGSRMHFFRALWNNSLQSEGFNLFDNLKNDITYDDLVYRADSLTASRNLKCFKHQGKILISYYSKLPKSSIEIRKENVLFFMHDVLDPSTIIWSGEMAKQRIGDLLPFEYGL